MCDFMQAIANWCAGSLDVRAIPHTAAQAQREGKDRLSVERIAARSRRRVLRLGLRVVLFMGALRVNAGSGIGRLAADRADRTGTGSGFVVKPECCRGLRHVFSVAGLARGKQRNSGRMAEKRGIMTANVTINELANVPSEGGG